MSQHARSSLSASAVRLTYLTSLTNLLFALIGAFVGWMTSSYVVQSEVPHDFTDALVLFLAARMFSTRPGLQRFLLWVVAVGYLYAAIGAGVMLYVTSSLTALQFPLPAEVSVSVTVPAVISAALGV